MMLQAIGIRFLPEEKAALDKLAQDQDRTRAMVVRRIVRAFLLSDGLITNAAASAPKSMTEDRDGN
jgi:predicted transcriptional regulator